MTLHTVLSYIKSTIRVIGFVLLANGKLWEAAVALIGAETLGIVEEMPGAYVGTKTTPSGDF